MQATRGEFNVQGFGGKFIGVGQGATLELHGQNKLGWTKITSTIPKITFDNGLIYDIHVRLCRVLAHRRSPVDDTRVRERDSKKEIFFLSPINDPPGPFGERKFTKRKKF